MTSLGKQSDVGHKVRVLKPWKLLEHSMDGWFVDDKTVELVKG